MINVTHPIYKPQVIEEKWLEKFIANGWTVEGEANLPPDEPKADPMVAKTPPTEQSEEHRAKRPYNRKSHA